jgi:hypothetical protein
MARYSRAKKPVLTLEPPSLPTINWILDGNSSSGSAKMSRRQSTPIVYTRVLENGAGAKTTELDQEPATRPIHYTKHQSLSFSDCDITSARELQTRSASRSRNQNAGTDGIRRASSNKIVSLIRHIRPLQTKLKWLHGIMLVCNFRSVF